jgi:hypothetical protein
MEERMTDKKVTMKIDEIQALMERLSMMGYHSVFSLIGDGFRTKNIVIGNAEKVMTCVCSLVTSIYENCESLSTHVDPKEYANMIRNYTLISIKKRGGEANETN